MTTVPLKTVSKWLLNDIVVREKWEDEAQTESTQILYQREIEELMPPQWL